DRTGKRRHQPAIRCAQPESIGTRYELADPPRYEPALQCAGAPCDVAEHCHMCDDPEWYPHDRGSADDVRSAFDRSSPEHGSDALPLTNPGARRPQGAYPMLAMIVVVTAAALAAGPSADAFAFSSGVSHVVSTGPPVINGPSARSPYEGVMQTTIRTMEVRNDEAALDGRVDDCGGHGHGHAQR